MGGVRQPSGGECSARHNIITGPLSGSLVGEHRNEAEAPLHLLMHSALSILHHQQHFLLVALPDRDHQASTGLQLVNQRRGDERCAARDEDTVEGRLQGQPREPIPMDRIGAIAQLCQTCLGLEVEGAMALDGEDAGTQFGKHGGLVAAAGADLQHLHAFGHLQEFGLEGHGPRLGDRLAAWDGERGILVGHLHEGRIIDELVPGHLADGREHAGVADTTTPQMLHQFAAQALVTKGIRYATHAAQK